MATDFALDAPCRVCLVLSRRTLAEDATLLLSQRPLVDMAELRVDMLDAAEQPFAAAFARVRRFHGDAAHSLRDGAVWRPLAPTGIAHASLLTFASADGEGRLPARPSPPQVPMLLFTSSATIVRRTSVMTRYVQSWKENNSCNSSTSEAASRLHEFHCLKKGKGLCQMNDTAPCVIRVLRIYSSQFSCVLRT